MKINLDYILKSHKDYLEEDFPDSKFLNRYSNKSISNTIKNSFKTLELLNLYMNHEKIRKEVQETLESLYDSILRFIYILPIGDAFFYSAIVRNISESVLRLHILMFDCSQSHQDVSTLSYRNIKEELNKIPQSKNAIHGPHLQFFKQIFSEGSNILHGGIIGNNIDYLYSIQREHICADIKSMKDFTENLLYVFTKSVPTIYNLTQKDYTTSQLSVLRSIAKQGSR